MSDLPSYELEAQAGEDRRRLHSSVTQLRFKLRENLDVKKNTREHLGLLCSVAGVTALAAGYAFAGIFVR